MPADDDWCRSPGRRGIRLAGALAGALALVVGLASPVFAADGLDVATDSTFAYDPAAASVHVTVDATLRNTKPDERSGNAVRRFFYSTATLPLPSGALEVQATSGGLDATVDIETVNDRVSRAIVKLDSNLFYGETRRVQLRYDLRSEVPRTKTFVRVNPAYASFVAYGAGDVGQVSVTVTVPAGFDIETLGDDVDRAVSGGSTVLTSGPIADPAEW